MYVSVKLWSLVSVIALKLSPGAGAAANRENSLPLLRLPYGTWRASSYDHCSGVYTFRNIRYAAPPVGSLRWSEPVKPAKNDTIQDGTYGPNCPQVIPPPPWGDDPIYKDLVEKASEDCLFLDVYVPKKALKPNARPLPVVVWIHGGGYTSGSKDMSLSDGLYDGRGLIQRAGGDLIVVSINYRLGAFGFLAGTSVENYGLPNAGMHDQRAALQWVRSYIHLVGGNPWDVSAWGESAGGGSIVYHLVGGGGKLDPLFQKAVIQSPGTWQVVDRKGEVEQKFEAFAAASGCNNTTPGDRMACLRAANVSALMDANVKLFPGATPTPDGKYIRQNAVVEFAKGDYWKHLKSVIISHTIDEGKLSLPSPIPESFVNDTINGTFPAYAAKQATALEELYAKRYSDLYTRADALMRDIVFSGNIRAVVEAYSNITWVMQYSGEPGTHGSDVPATWYRPGLYNLTKQPVWEEYQSYLVQQATAGDPNGKNRLHWPKVSGVQSEYLRNVMNVTDTGFELIEDGQSSKTVFEAWRKAIWETTRLGGYEMP